MTDKTIQCDPRSCVQTPAECESETFDVNWFQV